MRERESKTERTLGPNVSHTIRWGLTRALNARIGELIIHELTNLMGEFIILDKFWTFESFFPAVQTLNMGSVTYLLQK